MWIEEADQASSMKKPSIGPAVTTETLSDPGLEVHVVKF